eukprot:gnl/TRDRNA2_/TRDRNA2_113250_c0_seq1.p1 gnl/TRDRNA2_/TRDRNA2_113250_c0~~gnl/TRDRNA2_/TRDRNA2_113250_c0_seq1.p1  ORF type:complete len:130 (-),score=1.49 gnl/TRDRNA2_/TRDRNA2_113250_c0_seq1:160-549(-)
MLPTWLQMQHPRKYGQTDHSQSGQNLLREMSSAGTGGNMQWESPGSCSVSASHGGEGATPSQATGEGMQRVQGKDGDTTIHECSATTLLVVTALVLRIGPCCRIIAFRVAFQFQIVVPLQGKSRSIQAY